MSAATMTVCLRWVPSAWRKCIGRRSANPCVIVGAANVDDADDPARAHQGVMHWQILTGRLYRWLEPHLIARMFWARAGSSKFVITTSSLTVSKTAQLNCRSLLWSRPSPVEPGLMTRLPPIRCTTC